MKRELEGFDSTGFWDDNYYAREEYIGDALTDESIADVEKELGYKLPAFYMQPMKQHNGGIPFDTCFPADSPTNWVEDYIAITGAYGIGKEEDYPLCGEIGSQFMTDEWGYPGMSVTIYDCPSARHDITFLDYRECGPFGEPKAVYISQESDFKITTLAEDFEDFIRGLENAEEYEEQ